MIESSYLHLHFRLHFPGLEFYIREAPNTLCISLIFLIQVMKRFA